MLDGNALNEILEEEIRALKLGTYPTDGDAKRIALKLALTDRVIDAARLQVNLSIALKGSTTVPFVEGANGSDNERSTNGSTPSLQARTVPMTPMERAAQVLTAGPSPVHPWRRQT